MKRGVEARLSSRLSRRRRPSFVRVFEVVDVVQKQREEDARDARDDYADRRVRESESSPTSMFLSSSRG